MPYQPLYNIENKIEKKLKNLNLNPKTSVKKAILDQQANYVSTCYDSRGESYIFKARIFNKKLEDERGNPLLERNFKNEFYFYNALKNSPSLPEILQLQSISPCYINGEINGLDWFLYKKLEGTVLGNQSNPISKEVIEDPNIILRIVENILILQEIKPPMFNFLKKFDCKTHKAILKKLIERYQKITKPLSKKYLYFDFSNQKQRKLFEIVDKNKKLLDENLVLNHGDIHLANLVLINSGKNKKIFFIDWEKARYNNRAADLAFFWVKNASLLSFREKVVKKFTETDREKTKFWTLFKITALIWLVEEITSWQAALNKKEPTELAQKTLKQYINDFNEIIGEFYA